MDRAAPTMPQIEGQGWQPLDYARNAVFHIGEDGRLLDVNDTACLWLGYSRDELLRMTVFDVDPHMTRQAWETRRKNLRTHRSLSAQSHHRRKDGTIFPIELTTIYVEAPGQSYSITVVQDITSRRAIEEQLRKVVEQFSEAQRVAHVGSWEWIVGSKEETWSNEMFRIYGYEPGQFRPTNDRFLEHVHPEDREQVKATMQQALKQNEHFTAEFRMFRSNGELRHCYSRGRVLRDESGQPQRVIGISQDVTEQHQAQAEMEAMAHRLNEAQRVASIGTWEWDLVNQTAFWTDEMYRIYGRDPEVPITIESALASVHPDDQQRVNAVVAEALKHPEPFEVEHRILMPDESVRYCLGRGQVIHDDDGQPVRVFGTAQDITDRKQAELALRHSEAHYRSVADANRRLLAEVNHRVRNNLTGLLSLLRITREEADDVDQFATLMQQRITAMSKAHNLLAEAHWQSLDLMDMIRSAGGGYCVEDDARASFDGPPTRISPRQVVPLSLALHELFINAAKHGCLSAPDGRLRVTWRHDQHKLVLNWCESAGPPIEQPVKPSTGTELIRGFVCFELGGTLDLNFPSNGACHVLSIPLERQKD